MKLIATDQLHISSVKPDSLRPGEAFEVSDTLGAELMEKHPNRVKLAVDPEAKAEDAPANKAEPKPANKAEGAPKKRAAAKE